MADVENALSSIKNLGKAKMTGFVCKPEASITLNFEVEVPVEKMSQIFDALSVEPTPELVESLETTLQVVKNPIPVQEKLIYVC